MGFRTVFILGLQIFLILLVTDVQGRKRNKQKKKTTPQPEMTTSWHISGQLLTLPEGQTIAPPIPLDKVAEKDCVAGAMAVVMFDSLVVSKYMIWVAAVLLIVGMVQIFIGLFVFLAEALDIYLLLLNYCLASIVCILMVLMTGGGIIEASPDVCLYLSPLNCIVISVPVFTLFLLSYSRFYAITYPLYYEGRFTIVNQIVVCSLSWLIPTVVVAIGSVFCQSECLTLDYIWEQSCIIPSLATPLMSHQKFYHFTDGKPNETEYQHRDGPWYTKYTRSEYPARIECEIFMVAYVVTCLLLPLLGCFVCHGSIVYQLTVIKKNREIITNTSSANHDQELVTERESIAESKDRKKESMSELKNYLKSQTSKITQKAKDIKIPVSVILISTMYMFVAIPLTLVEVFSTKFGGGDGALGWIDMPAYLRQQRIDSHIPFCDEELKGAGPTLATWLLDICYSLGLLAFGLSPWAYIKFTKSFEKNLWKRPLKRFSQSLGL